MKTFLKSSAAVAMLLLAAVPAMAAGELHIFNWGDYTNPDLIKKFEDKYQVKVTLDSYDSNETMMSKVRAGNSGFVTDKQAEPILDFRSNSVVQGAIEGANVDPVREMTRLIEVTRTFDGVTNGVTQTENSLQDAIKTLGGAA